MIRGNTRFQSGEDKDLLVAANLEDGATAVADVEILIAVERDAGGDSHAFGIRGHISARGHAIHGAIMPRGSIHLALTIESDRGRIHHVGYERLEVVVVIDFED